MGMKLPRGSIGRAPILQGTYLITINATSEQDDEEDVFIFKGSRELEYSTEDGIKIVKRLTEVSDATIIG